MHNPRSSDRGLGLECQFAHNLVGAQRGGAPSRRAALARPTRSPASPRAAGGSGSVGLNAGTRATSATTSPLPSGEGDALAGSCDAAAAAAGVATKTQPTPSRTTVGRRSCAVGASPPTTATAPAERPRGWWLAAREQRCRSAGTAAPTSLTSAPINSVADASRSVGRQQWTPRATNGLAATPAAAATRMYGTS